LSSEWSLAWNRLEPTSAVLLKSLGSMGVASVSVSSSDCCRMPSGY